MIFSTTKSEHLSYKTPGCCLTDSNIKTPWLVFPVHPQEVHRDACQHDGQTDTADHGLRVEREDQQEGPEQQVDHWPYQAHLEEEEEWSVLLKIINPYNSLSSCWFTQDKVWTHGHYVMK